MTTATLPQTLPETGHDAFRLAQRFGQGTAEALYWDGVARGMMAAENPAGQWAAQYRIDAGRDWLAQPATLRFTHTLANMLPDTANRPRVYLLSGLLWGFKEATAHLADAEVCASCDRRILTTRDTGWEECPEHGIVHSECRPSMCDSGLCWTDGDRPVEVVFRP